MSIDTVPPPALKSGGVLVSNVCSLVSSGTEKAVIEFAKMNSIRKAKLPDLVKKVLSKIGQDGLLTTAQIVNNLISSLPLGYSCAGIITEVGKNVSDLIPGQRVACAGLGYANHAQVVYVPRKLVVPLPSELTFSEGALLLLSIAMHGVRQAELNVGETVCVIGMGLVGQITSQICQASGCKVACVDIDKKKVELV